MKNIKAALQKTFSFQKKRDVDDSSPSFSEATGRHDSISGKGQHNSSFSAAGRPDHSAQYGEPSTQKHASPENGSVPTSAFKTADSPSSPQSNNNSNYKIAASTISSSSTPPISNAAGPAVAIGNAPPHAAAAAAQQAAYQQQAQQAAAQAQQPGQPQQKASTYQSVTIAVAEHCPFALYREKWSLEDFELKKQMYAGQISLVYHAVDKRSGISVALKLYRRAKLNEMERHQVAREIKLHIELNHSSIIALYAAWKDRNYVYLALEWAPGGDVYTFLKAQGGRLTEDVAVPLILEPFLSAISYIHELGLIHRDIKPENILLNSSFQIKIADFGLSIDSRNEIANTRLGTIDYLAPEILDCPVKSHPMDNKDKPHIGYTNKVDCWSVGVLAYEVLVGRPPFEAMNAHETLKRIKYKKVDYPSDLSPGAVDFIKCALVRDPEQRGTIDLLRNHAWIRAFAKKRENLANRNRARRSRTLGQSTGLESSADLLLVDSPSLPPLLKAHDEVSAMAQLRLQQAQMQQVTAASGQLRPASSQDSRPHTADHAAHGYPPGVAPQQQAGARLPSGQPLRPMTVGAPLPSHVPLSMTYSHSANNIRQFDPAERAPQYSASKPSPLFPAIAGAQVPPGVPACPGRGHN